MNFEYLNLTHGQRGQVPLDWTSALAGPVRTAIMESSLQLDAVAVTDTEFLLYADLSHGCDGFGHFMLSASSLCRSAPAGAVFYVGAVATELASAPQAWRTLVTAYFSGRGALERERLLRGRAGDAAHDALAVWISHDARHPAAQSRARPDDDNRLPCRRDPHYPQPGGHENQTSWGRDLHARA